MRSCKFPIWPVYEKIRTGIPLLKLEVLGERKGGSTRRKKNKDSCGAHPSQENVDSWEGSMMMGGVGDFWANP